MPLTPDPITHDTDEPQRAFSMLATCAFVLAIAFLAGPTIQINPNSTIGPIIYQPVEGGPFYEVKLYQVVGTDGYLALTSNSTGPATPQQTSVLTYTNTVLNLNAQFIPGCPTNNTATVPGPVPFSALTIHRTNQAPITVYHRIRDAIALPSTPAHYADSFQTATPTDQSPLILPGVTPSINATYISASASINGQLVPIYIQNVIR